MSLLKFKHPPLQMKIFTLISTFAVLQITLQDLGFHDFNKLFHRQNDLTKNIFKYLILYSTAITSFDDTSSAIICIIIYIFLDIFIKNIDPWQQQPAADYSMQMSPEKTGESRLSQAGVIAFTLPRARTAS